LFFKEEYSYLISILLKVENLIKQNNYLFISENVAVVKGIRAVLNVDAAESVLRKMLTTQSLLFWDPVEQVILLE
jgi:hypothetical protein